MSDLQQYLNKTFPQEKDLNRITTYTHYRGLLGGEHFNSFAIKAGSQFQSEYDRLKYVTCNFTGLVSKVISDLLFGEEIRIKSENNSDFFKKLYFTSKLKTKLYESSLQNSALGDNVFKIRTLNEQIFVDVIDPSIYFPSLDSNQSNSETNEASLAWKETHELGGKVITYVIIEKHTKGLIETFIFMTDENGKVSAEVDVNNYNSMYGTNYTAYAETGVDRLLLVHTPNYREDGSKYWGVSDYKDIESLVFALNNRMSKNEEILDKHSSPILAVPDDILDEDGNIRKESFDLIGMGEDGAVPQYITWNAELSGAFKQIDKIVEFLFMFSETAPEALGLGQGKAESGRALKMRLIRTIAKRNRKRLYYDQAIKEVLNITTLLSLQGYKADTFRAVSEEIPSIIWSDGLVNDMIEDVELEISKLEAGLTTKKRAIMNTESLEEDEAELLIKEIDEEDEKKMKMFNINGKANPIANDNEEEDENNNTQK